MPEIKVMVFQTRGWREKEKNLRQMAEQMAEQVTGDVDLVTFPEMFCCPYENEAFPVYAEEEGGETWQWCSRLAKKYGVYLSAGTVPERDKEGHIYNTAYVFDRQGRAIAKHRKVHLFDIDIKGGQFFKESDTLTQGNEVTVFDTDFGKVGLCICYDLRFPEMARLMADRGAVLILVPAAFNDTTGPAHWDLLFRSRAVDNQVYYIGTAPARDEGAAYQSWGHSLIVDPWGRIVSQLDEKEGSLKGTLDLDVEKAVRQQLPLLSQRRKDLYKIIEPMI